MTERKAGVAAQGFYGKPRRHADQSENQNSKPPADPRAMDQRKKHGRDDLRCSKNGAGEGVRKDRQDNGPSKDQKKYPECKPGSRLPLRLGIVHDSMPSLYSFVM